MESPDLKPTPPDDPALEAWLRSGAALPPLRDDGFSRRVIASLPPPRPRVSQRLWVCVAGTVAGLAVFALAVANGGAPLSTLPALGSGAEDVLHDIAMPLALTLAALSVWFAFRHRLQQLTRL